MKTENQATVADIWRMTIRKIPRAIGPATFSVGKYEDEKGTTMRIGIQKLKPPQAAEKTSIDVNSKTLREKEKPCKHLHGFIMVVCTGLEPVTPSM